MSGNDNSSVKVDGSTVDVRDLVTQFGQVTILAPSGQIIVPHDGDVRIETAAQPIDGTPAIVLGRLNPKTDIGRPIQTDNLDRGIYQGIWRPQGNQELDFFAAPKDLGVLRTFNDTVVTVAELRNFHGHNGGHFRNQEDVLRAVCNNPPALRDWFVPNRELLHGEDIRGNLVQEYNLYANRGNMPEGSEFVTKVIGSVLARWYWSCTEHPGGSSLVYNVNFTDGGVDWNGKDTFKLSVRPVRAELRL